MNIKEADMSSALKTPFTNIQQELLQLYTREVSDEDLKT